MIKKTSVLLYTLILPLSMYAFHYRPELDGEGGMFLVTGDDAISGILMLLGCISVVFICYKIGGLIDKDEETKGVKHTISNIFYIIGAIACIAAIGFAFAIWWIMLILFVIYLVGLTIYQYMRDG